MSIASERTVPRLPPSGPARKALQATGQFWTPGWVAGPMAGFVLAANPRVVFDPAVGAGAFFRACRELGYDGRFSGFEPDSSALDAARAEGLSTRDLRGVVQGDFFRGAVGQYAAILSNPPYLRHHRISPAMKASLRSELRRSTGIEIDGRAGLHVYFLIWCLNSLKPGGRLAFILPADTCEGVFADTLWGWITQMFCLRAFVTFGAEATPFPGVDTNAFVVAIERSPPKPSFLWARLESPDQKTLASILLNTKRNGGGTLREHRTIAEALETGFTRPRRRLEHGRGVTLRQVAQVRRGIATGANEFFFLNRQQIRDKKLAEKWFTRAIGRTRDCPGEVLDGEQLEKLDSIGRPTWLLDLPERDPENFPKALRDYLAEGISKGYPERALVKSRRLWFRSEQRSPPPILFAYLGRRSCRFILNRAGVVPLTGFLCVYPRSEAGIEADTLWRLLNDERTLTGLAFVGKSYGSGAIKVEPRALERLLLPHSVCKDYKLDVPARMVQMRLLERRAKYTAKANGVGQ